MSEEEMLSLNNYLEDLYQAMQIGDIVFEPKHSRELYNLINKLLKENRKYKELINKAIKHVSSLSSRGRDCMIYADVKKDILDILKEVEDD